MDNERNDKCVYIHKLDGRVVYVGMGNRTRLFGKANRSKEHLEVWGNLEKEIVKDNLTLDEAIELEYQLINKYSSEGENLFNRKFSRSSKTLPIDYLKLSEYIYYDETSATKLRWAKDIKFTKFKLGDEAGCSNNKSYSTIVINRVNYRVHRLVYCMYHKINLSENLVVDHTDGNKSNNCIENLRLVSQSENCKNKKHTGSNTIFQNIYEDQKRMRFTARYSENLKSKTIHFSYRQDSIRKTDRHFNSREEAMNAAIIFREKLIESGIVLITDI
jgi:hypothetical protein